MNDHQPGTLLAKCWADRIRLIAIETMKGAFGNEGALRYFNSDSEFDGNLKRTIAFHERIESYENAAIKTLAILRRFPANCFHGRRNRLQIAV